MLTQCLKVRTDTVDGDDDGNHWHVHYVLYRNADDAGAPCFDLYEDDGNGNGKLVCRGHNETAMRSLTLQLGEFVEWGVGVGRAQEEPARDDEDDDVDGARRFGALPGEAS